MNYLISRQIDLPLGGLVSREVFLILYNLLTMYIYGIYNKWAVMLVNENLKEFLWDAGNRDKNQLKHRVEGTEAEEVFFDDNKVVLKDCLHSGKEERYLILGTTKRSRLLFIVYTVRTDRIRVISARDVSKRERKLYEEAN